MIDWMHPALIMIAGAFFVPVFKGTLKKAYLLLLPLLAFVAVLYSSPGTYWVCNFLGNELIFGRVDRLSLIFGYVFTMMGFIGALYALHVDDSRQSMAALFYAGSSLGVVFAGDYFTLFVFWEIMAFASAYLIFAQRSDGALKAGTRYLLVHIFGGVCLIGGIVIHFVNTGSLLFGPIEGGGTAFYLILIGFLLNAAVPPLSAWLSDAYPEATITGSVFLCAFTTKTAVYVLVRGFPGTEILVPLGVFMALYGVVYAVLENNCRRLLAYHIISQVGYMVAGVGMGTDMALNGAVSHAFAHILYKSLLFMGVGAVILATGKEKLTELGGIWRGMPITVTLYMIGAFAISAFPLFSGFVSKSMVISAAASDHRAAVSLLLTLASAGTFLHTGLKLPYYMFFGENKGLKGKEPPTNMLLGMGVAAFMCIALGVFPGTFYSLLPYPVHFNPYTGDHVTSALGMLMFTAVGFFMLLKKLDPESTISVDTDWFYRKGSRIFMWFAYKPISAADNFVSELYITMILRPKDRLAYYCGLFDIIIIDSIVNAAAWLLRSLAWVSHQFDIYIVDGIINSAATLVDVSSSIFRRLQNGYLQSYAVLIVIGLTLIIGGVIFF